MVVVVVGGLVVEIAVTLAERARSEPQKISSISGEDMGYSG